MSDQSRIPVEDRPDTPIDEGRGGGEERPPEREGGPASERGSGDAHAGGDASDAEDDVDLFAPLPDDLNPAIIDARKAYIITMLGSILFCGAVIVFLLL